MMTEDLCDLGVFGLAGLLRRKEVSPVAVVDAFLRRIAALNSRLCAYLTVTANAAREQARQAEAEIAAGHWRGPLHGIPYGVKDIIETDGVPTTHGSSFFRNFVPDRDADCIVRLRRAGAIMLGKTLTHEFAAAATTINPHYGTARNPWNPDCIAGGSSGGSAVAVAAGLGAFALGTDTGGSIRNPAALCGVVGLKPTHGRTSLTGVCPNVTTLDHVGPIARSARDAALVLQAIAGYDPRDAASREAPVPDFTEGWSRGVRGMRLVLCPDFYVNAELDDDVARAFADAVEVFRALGAAVETVPFADGNRLSELFTVIAGPEFAEFHRPFHERDPDGYGASVKERLDWSFRVTADEYVRGLRERTLRRRQVADFFRDADALLLPAMPCAAPPIATLRATVNGRELPFASLHQPFLRPGNVTGCPTVAVPMGFDRNGMPLSLQILGPEWSDGRILGIASAYEEATPWFRACRPPAAATG
ncbi:MAG: amidase [Alphaproteobacteria bacterium]|nr:amidase [Alphaproteobacteria bacterium]